MNDNSFCTTYYKLCDKRQFDDFKNGEIHLKCKSKPIISFGLSSILYSDEW